MNNTSENQTVSTDKQSRLSLLRLILILGSLSTFGPLSIDMYLPALPKLEIDLSTSTSLAQLSLTACLMGIAFGQIAAGPISDIQGRKKPLLIGLAVYAAASLLCAFAGTIEQFVLLRFIQGLAGSAGIVISRASVRDLYSGSEMTRFFSMLMLVSGAAPILAPIFGGQILQLTSWRGVFVVLAVIGLLMFTAVLFGLKETLPVEQRSLGGLSNTLHTFRQLMQNAAFMGYALSQGFASAAMFAYISGSPFVLQNIFGVSPQLFSLFFAINGAGIILAGQITGRLAGRIPERRLLQAGLSFALLGGVSLLAMVLTGGALISILLPLFLVVSSVGIIGASCFTLAMQNQARAAGSASALLGLLSFILGGTLAPFVGIAGSFSALPMAIIIALSELAAVLSYVLLVKGKQPRPAPINVTNEIKR